MTGIERIINPMQEYELTAINPSSHWHFVYPKYRLGALIMVAFLVD